MSALEDRARQYVCPKCHSLAGKPCMKNRRPIGRSTIVMPGTAMKSVHAERLALVPAETPARGTVVRGSAIMAAEREDFGEVSP